MGKLSQVKKDIICFKVYCNCSTQPLRMKFTGISQEFFKNKCGIFVCGKCGEKKKVECVSLNRYEVKDM